MEQENSLNRREFLKNSALVSGGLIVAFYLPPQMNRVMAQEGPPILPKTKQKYPPNAFIQIAPDNSITMVINKCEMGQGVNTSMAQLIAEELECDWTKIRSVSAPVDPVYNHTEFPMQLTGGSTALRTSWDQHRVIGAGMREMLKAAGAQRWRVNVDDVRAENGFIINKKSGAKLTYGDLANEAAKIPYPENPPLKESKDFKIIGQSMKRVDSVEKSNGKAIFGIDVRAPGMLYVAVARPHLQSATLKSYNNKAAKAVKGVVKVVKFDNKVAVLAKNSHIARVACDALKPVWDYKQFSKVTTESLMTDFKSAADKPAVIAREDGNVDAAVKNATQTMTFQYEFPFLAHATMEPMNCTVNYDGKKAEIWAGHQMPTVDRDTAAEVLGLAKDKVDVHTVYAGGGFGRRANKNSDFVVEACKIAKIVKKPLKVVWSREDDTRGGYYRPMAYHEVRVGLDGKNNLLTWDHHIMVQSIFAHSFMANFFKGPVEEIAVEGTADTVYTLPNFRVKQSLIETPLTTLWWRSVGNTHTAYVMETVIDELAEKANKDPFAFRRELIKKSPRHLAVLDLLEKQTKQNLSKPVEGRAWGLAIHECFKSVVGHVAEISIENGNPRVHRVWSAVHCGQVVNPECAKTQIEGAIAFGLSSLHQQIQLKNGLIAQGNFDTYPVVRIQDMPVVHVDFVQTKDPPTGLGEPGVPPVLPAIANAYYRLTKTRLRVLPLGTERKA